MQIPSIPPPIITTPLAQDMAAKAIPNLQATQPLVQNAVKEPPKGEKSSGSDGKKNSAGYKNPGQTTDPVKSDHPDGEDPHSLNISV